MVTNSQSYLRTLLLQSPVIGAGVLGRQLIAGVKGVNVSNLNDPRVLFAAERTLLAWNRTSLAFIAFGFVVERAGLMIETFAPGSLSELNQYMTTWLGLAFIALGAFSSAYSSRQFMAVVRTLNPSEFPEKYGIKWGMIMNYIVAGLGVALAVALTYGRAT